MKPQYLTTFAALIGAIAIITVYGCKNKEPGSRQQASSEKVDAALLFAAEYGNIDQVRLLISKGTHFKTNALHVAAEYGQKDVAELLVLQRYEGCSFGCFDMAKGPSPLLVFGPVHGTQDVIVANAGRVTTAPFRA